MKTETCIALPILARFACFAAAALLAAATLAGWNRFGVDILLDSALSGLSWCF